MSDQQTTPQQTTPLQTAPSSENRREYTRRTLPDTSTGSAVPGVRFLRAGAFADEAIPARLADVSRQGIRIVSKQPLFPGEPIQIEIHDAQQHLCLLTAQVAWNTIIDDQHHMGCELRVALTREQQAVLNQLMQ